MHAAAHKPLNLPVVILLAGLACAPILLAPAERQAPVMVGVLLAVAALFAVYAVDLLTLALGWLVVTTVFGGYFWRFESAGFFNLTIDRIAFVGLLGMLGIGLAVGRYRWQWSRRFALLLLLLLGWLALTAQLSGWTIHNEQLRRMSHVSPPYYQFIAGYLFPAVLFMLAVTAARSENQIRTVLLFFTFFGLYLTVIGLAEQFAKSGWLGGHNVWSRLIWPKYILDLGLGIHAERVRGPFLNAPDMGLTLTVCLFANLLLMRRAGPGGRIALALISLPLPLLVFWSQTRSIWVGLVGSLFLAAWYWPRSRRFSLGTGLLIVALLAALSAVFWSNLSSRERERGGFGDEPPIIARIEQSKVAWEMLRREPLTGVGLGHFQEAGLRTGKMTEPGSRAYLYARTAVEHNNFISLLAETGLPGFALYTLLVFGILAVSVRLYRLLPATATGYLDRRFVVFFWIVWFCYFINAMFRLTTSSPFPNGMFLLLGGLVVGLYLQLQPQPLRYPPAPRFGRGGPGPGPAGPSPGADA